MSIIWVGPNPFDQWNPLTQCFGCYATDDLGIEVKPASETASRWCAQGWMNHEHIPRQIQSGFNRWLIDHYNGNPITVLNDICGWKPIDFSFAWDKYMIDLRSRPDYYGCG